MKIGGLQKLTLLDYPGKTACTVFLPGCNFRCPYCHNGGLVLPDSREPGIPEEEFFAYLEKRIRILDGVCVAGGEPLLQEGILPFLKKIKSMGYQVKLDTNGTSPQLLKEACEEGLVDYVAMDIKQAPEHYEKAVGITKPPMETVKESISYLLSGKVDYEFRTTLVKGIHETEDVIRICDWIEGAKIWYLQNFRDSGNLLGEGTKEMVSFSEEELLYWKELAEKKGITASVRNF